MEVHSKMSMSAHSEKSCSQAVAAVFRVHLLLDMILEYVILDRNTLLSTVSIYRTCRLINKAFLQSTSRILLKSRKPLFRIHLHDWNSTAGIPQNRNLLDHFLKSLDKPLYLMERVPPHLIRISNRYFPKENTQLLLDCLSKCGAGLLELHLSLANNYSIQNLNSSTSFAKLQLFSVTNYATVKEENDGISLIQSVLDASKQLVSFVFQCVYCANPDCVDNRMLIDTFSLSDLVLPSSITHMDLHFKLNDRHLQVLVKNCLPNLKTLKLQGVQVSDTGELISSILQNVRRSLQKFYLAGEGERMLLMPGHLKLPLMEKLKNLSMRNMFLELGEGHPSLQHLLPALKQTLLTNQTPAMFAKWTRNSCFESVTSLTVSWDNLELGRRHFIPNHLQLIHMEPLPRIYPNLQRLDVTIDNRVDVEIIWRELTRLRYLRIRAENVDKIQGSNAWDGLLIGIPAERVETLKESPGSWGELQIASTYSIRNLNDLQTLFLITSHKPKSPLISNATFHFAFLMMPNLTELVLEGKFCLAPSQATKDVKEQWERQGRSIEMYK